jgi:hypothetical protein
MTGEPVVKARNPREQNDTAFIKVARVTTVIVSILGLALLLDIAATVLLVRSTVVTPPQKALQLAFTWAAPFVGSIIVIAVLRETIGTHQPRRESSAGDVWLPGIGPESAGQHAHHGDGGGDVGHGGDAGGHQ